MANGRKHRTHHLSKKGKKRGREEKKKVGHEFGKKRRKGEGFWAGSLPVEERIK